MSNPVPARATQFRQDILTKFYPKLFFLWVHVRVSARTDPGARFRAPGGVLGSFTPGSAHIVLLYNIAINVRQLFKQKHIFRSQNKYSISAVPFYYGLLTYSAKNYSILRKSMQYARRASPKFSHFDFFFFHSIKRPLPSIVGVGN